MTYEKALEASRALDAIEGFQFFIEEVDKAIESAEEFTRLSLDFKQTLNTLLRKEQKRLEKELEDM